MDTVSKSAFRMSRTFELSVTASRPSTAVLRMTTRANTKSKLAQLCLTVRRLVSWAARSVSCSLRKNAFCLASASRWSTSLASSSPGSSRFCCIFALPPSSRKSSSSSPSSSSPISSFPLAGTWYFFSSPRTCSPDSSMARSVSVMDDLRTERRWWRLCTDCNKLTKSSSRTLLVKSMQLSMNSSRWTDFSAPLITSISVKTMLISSLVMPASSKSRARPTFLLGCRER
mmetsp:Transcript_54205/g.158261  ORF Transcript_54205/g.158261 Transcript_54205/m.158261 type:complete len:229 (+) Transcript_54205:2169-2855(+)